MMKNNKWTAIILCALTGCLILAGCMNAGARVIPGAESTAQPENSFMPGLDFGATVMPQTTATGMPELFDWLQGRSDVEGRINMISEIRSSRVIVNGNTALVGVVFADEYQGEMTRRIHDMVAGEIQTADRNIRTVAVTAAEEDVRKINELADRIDAGESVDQLEGEIDAIVRNVTTVQ